MALIGWVDPDSLDTLWPESGQLELADLETYLAAAYDACLAYAPPLPLGKDQAPVIPAAWSLAQVMHAKHLYARFRTGNRDTIGADGYTISTYPLVLESRGLLRPKRPAFRGLL